MCLHTLRLREAFCSQVTEHHSLWLKSAFPARVPRVLAQDVFQAPTTPPDKYSASQRPTQQSME